MQIKVIDHRKLSLENMEEVKKWCNGKTWSRPPLRAITGITVPTEEGDVDVAFGGFIYKRNNNTFHVLQNESMKIIANAVFNNTQPPQVTES